MRASGLLRVRTHRVDLDALAGAALAGDLERVAAILDDALEFRGLLGPVFEAIDGPLFAATAELLVGVAEQAIRRASSGG